jgi:hypothetical protein
MNIAKKGEKNMQKQLLTNAIYRVGERKATSDDLQPKKTGLFLWRGKSGFLDE